MGNVLMGFCKDPTKGTVNTYKDPTQGGFEKHKDLVKAGVHKHKDLEKEGCENHKDPVRAGVEKHKDPENAGFEKDKNIAKAGFEKQRGRSQPRRGSDVSAWEKSLGCINSLLQPGSATFEAMTEDEREGLRDLRIMLLLGDRVEKAKTHVPLALLDTSDRRSSKFLLAQYAGYSNSAQGRASMGKVLSAKRVAIKMKKIASDSLQRSQELDFTNGNTIRMPDYWNDLDNESKLKLRDLLSWESLSRWDFDIFELDNILKGKNALVFVSWAIIASPHAQYAMDVECSKIPDVASEDFELPADREGYNFIRTLNVRPSTLLDFFHKIETKYEDVIYHNQLHAADVTQGLHALLQMGGEKYSSGKLETFSILVASIVHDVGHKGLSNSFLVNSKSDLAIRYNDVSVSENMHLSIMFRLLLGDTRDRKVDIFENFSEAAVDDARKIIIHAVLSTDMTKHFTKNNTIKGIILKELKGELNHGCSYEDDRNIMIELLSFFCMQQIYPINRERHAWRQSGQIEF